jgi:HlyD family secretion protein
VLSITGLGGCNSTDEKQTGGNDIYEVQRGDLFISIPADGNLEMPNQVELRFGTAGAVQEVLVEEGDRVKAGALLARLDITGQKLAIESAEYDLQLAANNLAQTIPGLSQMLGYPRRYPNIGALHSFEKAQEEVEEAQRLLSENKNDEALSELRLAQYDLESSINVLGLAIKDVETYPDIALDTKYGQEVEGVLDNVLTYPSIPIAIENVRNDLERITNAQNLIEQTDYDVATSSLADAQKYLDKTHRLVENSIGLIIRRTMSFPDIATGFDYMQSAVEKLNQMQTLMEQDERDEILILETLRMGEHDLEMSNSILTANEVVLDKGLSLKVAQDHKMRLKRARASLKDSREQLMKAVILAPFDGTIVDVGLSEDDQLSAQNYSSRTAVHLVDTETIKFEGSVDEIDIFQVKVGQKANIIIDAIADQELSGTVTFISPAGSSTTGVISFTVTIELDPTKIELKGGLTATADIIIENRVNVLLIPVEAIIETPEGLFTQVLDESTGELEKRQIIRGAQSIQFAEVISGLNEGEKIVTVTEK